MTEKKPIDWERIELDYRAGILTLREMASEAGVTEGAIRKRAKRDDWVRDLSAKIKAKADDLVRRHEVRSTVRTDLALTERVLISAGAEAILAVRIGHKVRITRHSELLDTLQAELESDGSDLATRVDISKKLSDTLKTLITLERDAFDIAPASKLEISGKDGGPIKTQDVTELSDSALAALINDNQG
jgi:hypothetical protein